MSGQWWESDLIVGPFANITEANAWAAANPSSLFLGLSATIGGSAYIWTSGAWVAVSRSSRYGVVAIGDSITERGGAGGGWFDYACFLSSGRLRCIANLAVGGYKISQMLPKCDEAIAYNPEEIWFQGGSNIPAVSGIPAQIAKNTEDLLVIIKKCKSAGITLRIFGIPVMGSGAASYSHQWNQAQAAIAFSNGLKYTFLWDFMADSSGNAITSLYNEGAGLELHPKKSSSLIAAQNIALEYPTTAFGVELSAYSSAPDFGKITDPLLMNGTSVVATGWTSTADGTNNIATRSTANTRGYKQALTRALVNGSDPSIKWVPSSLTPGKTYDISFRLDVTTVNGGTLNNKIFFKWQAGDYSQSREDKLQYHSCAFSGTVYARFTVPIWASAAASILYFQILGSEANGDLGSMSWETIQIIDVAAAGG